MSFFTFTADLPHQLAAVNNVAELFDGLDKRAAASFLNVEDIIGNADEWDDLADDLVEENLHRIQRRHNEEQPEASLVMGRLPDVNLISPLTTTTLPHRLSLGVATPR